MNLHNKLLSLCWYHWWNFALTTFFVIILIMFAKINFGVSGARVWNGSRGLSPGNIGAGWRHPCWTQRQWQLELWTFFGSKFNIFHWSPAVVCIYASMHTKLTKLSSQLASLGSNPLFSMLMKWTFCTISKCCQIQTKMVKPCSTISCSLLFDISL